MIIVTGGAGFIGSATIAQLNANGVQDILVVDELGKDNKWKNLSGLCFMDYLEKEDFLEAVLQDELGEVDAIIHLGACSDTTEADASYLIHNNFEYSKVLISYASTHQVRMIYASSAATYGDGEQGFTDREEDIDRLRPLNMYGYSKQMLDQWVYHQNLMDEVVSLKYFNVFGPNESHKGDMRSMVNKAYFQINNTGSVNLFKSHREGYKDGEEKRDYIYVKDAVKMTLFFLDHRDVGGIYNIGTGEAHSWNDLMAAIFKAMNKVSQINFIDMPNSIRDQYQYFTEADISKIRATGYQEPMMSLEKAVEDYVKNYLETGAYL
jgi:ADP-L-glycero-D-manno-heptose 6-epimerase